MPAGSAGPLVLCIFSLLRYHSGISRAVLYIPYYLQQRTTQRRGVGKSGWRCRQGREQMRFLRKRGVLAAEAMGRPSMLSRFKAVESRRGMVCVRSGRGQPLSSKLLVR